MAAAFGLMSAGTACVAAVLVGADAQFTLSNEALSDLAQIGATLLIAYAIETSWFVKESRTRGRERENWIGFVAGIGLSSVIGIAIAIALVGAKSSSFLATLGVTWMLFSLGFLSVLVACWPYVIYSWVHSIRAEYSDE
jgi:cytochrome bd-type quinol oxidase subunit 2